MNTDSKTLTLVIAALKEAYANGHQCDLADRCPGCMAGYALEAITGRKWTQDECQPPTPELKSDEKTALDQLSIEDPHELHGREAGAE